jgi:hypothetical protein
VGERAYVERTFEPGLLFCGRRPLADRRAVGVSALKPSRRRISSVLAAQE